VTNSKFFFHGSVLFHFRISQFTFNEKPTWSGLDLIKIQQNNPNLSWIMKVLNTRYDFVNNKKVDDCQSFITSLGVLLVLTWCNNGICFNEIQQKKIQQEVSDFQLPHIVVTLATSLLNLLTNVSIIPTMIINKKTYVNIIKKQVAFLMHCTQKRFLYS